MDGYELVNIEGMKTIDTIYGPLEVDGFLKQIEAAEKIIEAYSSFNDKILRVQRGITRRAFRYKDESCDTKNELSNLKKFITDYKDKEPNKTYNVKVRYIDEYDDYGKLEEEPTWGEKFTNLFNVFDTLIKPSLTADNVVINTQPVKESVDKVSKWTRRGVIVSIVASVVSAIISITSFCFVHSDAVNALNFSKESSEKPTKVEIVQPQSINQSKENPPEVFTEEITDEIRP